MFHGLSVRALVGSLVLAGGATAQAPRPATDAWRDPTPHRERFITVASDVRLHTLDFGGSGPPLLFLAGLGNTAHAWDNFATRFTDRFRVYAITRRGFGESSHPDEGYELDTLVNDIRTVLDTLKLDRVSIVGHSIAAEELTRFAVTYPERVHKLVYLDGAYDRPRLSEMADSAFTEPIDLPSMPQPTARDTATPAAYVRFVHRTRGVDIPEADIRARLKYDGAEESATYPYQAVGSAAESPRWREIRAPALAVYAVVDSVDQGEPWVRADRARRRNQQRFLNKIGPIYAVSREKFRREMQRGTIVEIRGGHHWIFLSHADRVSRTMRDFLLAP
jgi:pimeloyl-ACP methyl ester carboxylesterase